ncbi:MAG: Flp pilus assembly complex ATPase component TadA [Limnobacter sp.]|nr:Flp pilus assembly complex ATPase component TadA [Limnobacter sp.]
MDIFIRDNQSASLTEGQVELLRAQQGNLRGQGQSLSLDELAVRARFASGRENADKANTGASDLGSLLPVDLCRRYLCEPLSWQEGVLTIRSALRLNQECKNIVRKLCRLDTERVVVLAASRVEILRRLSQTDQGATVPGLLHALETDGVQAVRLRQLVFALLRETVERRASDIHLSRRPDPDAWVMFRVDSEMQYVHLISASLMQALVARIKIEAGLDASNSRTAQDGRLSVEIKGRSVDFRVSTQPVVDGESVVLRTLDSSILPTLDELFPCQPRLLSRMRKLTQYGQKRGGLVFISGATGSGKSTTQYALACSFQRHRMNLITVEDPVEYVLPFAKQIQLHALINQKAIELERSILRQDPDVLIFGEIRDADSARAALAFAESGHLVISTIHANGVLQVAERFLSIVGSEYREDARFLLANYLNVCTHQKLVKRLCDCKTPVVDEALERVKTEIFTSGIEGLFADHGFYQANGCEKCRGTGYLGRIAVNETMMLGATPDERSLFVEAFLGNQLHVQSALNDSNGIEMFSREETLSVLLMAGQIDWPSAQMLLDIKEIGV